MRNRFFLFLTYLCCCHIFAAQAQPMKTVGTKNNSSTSVAISWADLTLRLMTKTRYNTPTYGSRALGYMGLTMYETVAHYSAKYRPVANTLCDTLLLPKPPPKKLFCPELALNAGQAVTLKAFFGFANKQKWIDSLETAIQKQYAVDIKPAAVAASIKYGQAVANRIYEWSKTDGGDGGWDRNFPQDYVRPVGIGLWVPPIVGQSNTKIPMHPTWGGNRTFSQKNAGLPMPPPLVYSEDSTSEFYKQYKEVFDLKNKLTDAQRNTVMWWGDDPTQTFSPPGHSYNLGTIAIRASNADLIKAAQTYAQVGMAVSDAFVCCWKVKFAFMVERPSSFVDKMFNKYKKMEGPWLPFFLEPPFPSFYSGHAVQSAATATVLAELYGKQFSFTDSTHAKRPTIKYTLLKPLTDNIDAKTYSPYNRERTQHELLFSPRSYKSFWEAAQECADSRLMGGIHTRHDNEIGLQEGIKIGGNINALRWN